MGNRQPPNPASDRWDSTTCETFEKRFPLSAGFKIKAHEDFNHRNILNISRIEIRMERRDWAKGGVFQRSPFNEVCKGGSIMKRLSILIFCIVFVLVSEVWAAPPVRPTQEKFKERLVTMRNWKLMEEFNLSGEKAQNVFNILKKYDDERERLIIRRRDLFKDLKEEADSAEASEEKLIELIGKLRQINVELARLPEQELKGLGAVFNLKDQARYLLFVERFGREMQRLVPMRRPDRRRDLPGR